MNKQEKYKKILKYILIIIIMISIIFTFTNNKVLADVGNNNTYEDTPTYKDEYIL